MIHRTTDLAAAHCDAPVWFWERTQIQNRVP